MTSNISCPNRRYTYICDVLNVAVCVCLSVCVNVTFVCLLWITSFHHHIRGTIPHMYLSKPLQESSDVIILGQRSELSSLNQKLEEMTSYQVAM